MRLAGVNTVAESGYNYVVIMDGPCNIVKLLTPKVCTLSKRHITGFRQGMSLASMIDGAYTSRQYALYLGLFLS